MAPLHFSPRIFDISYVAKPRNVVLADAAKVIASCGGRMIAVVHPCNYLSYLKKNPGGMFKSLDGFSSRPEFTVEYPQFLGRVHNLMNETRLPIMLFLDHKQIRPKGALKQFIITIRPKSFIMTVPTKYDPAKNGLIISEKKSQIPFSEVSKHLGLKKISLTGEFWYKHNGVEEGCVSSIARILRKDLDVMLLRDLTYPNTEYVF